MNGVNLYSPPSVKFFVVGQHDADLSTVVMVTNLNTYWNKQALNIKQALYLCRKQNVVVFGMGISDHGTKSVNKIDAKVDWFVCLQNTND